VELFDSRVGSDPHRASGIIKKAVDQCERIADAAGRPACKSSLWVGPETPEQVKAER
jgi:hypothetical protein